MQNRFQISETHSIKYVVGRLLSSLNKSITGGEEGHDLVDQGTNARMLTENNMEDKEDAVDRLGRHMCRQIERRGEAIPQGCPCLKEMKI